MYCLIFVPLLTLDQWNFAWFYMSCIVSHSEWTFLKCAAHQLLWHFGLPRLQRLIWSLVILHIYRAKKMDENYPNFSILTWAFSDATSFLGWLKFMSHSIQSTFSRYFISSIILRISTALLGFSSLSRLIHLHCWLVSWFHTNVATSARTHNPNGTTPQNYLLIFLLSVSNEKSKFCIFIETSFSCFLLVSLSLPRHARSYCSLAQYFVDIEL